MKSKNCWARKGFTPAPILMHPEKNKQLVRGYTTGTCAQAAAKAAGLMLFKNRLLNKVGVETPSGVKLNLKLTDQGIGHNFAQCAVIKDSGSDPDVTNGVKVYAEVRTFHKQGIIVRGGEGVGRVTLPGLAVGKGEWAINPTPRKMILREIEKLLPQGKGAIVTISVPAGRELAKLTYNPRLGIKGGISIIGTTGIVEAKSLAAYKASLALELNVLLAQGIKRPVFVLGYVGENYCKKVLKLKEDSFIKIGDHIGFMLKECAKRKIKELLLIGHIGKLVKLANGQFNTNYKFGDNRLNTIARYAKMCHANASVIKDILKQETAEATIEILKKANGMQVYKRIAQDVVRKAVEFTGNKFKLRCIILSLKGEVLAKV